MHGEHADLRHSRNDGRLGRVTLSLKLSFVNQYKYEHFTLKLMFRVKKKKQLGGGVQGWGRGCILMQDDSTTTLS